jgi:hypothetical protein
MNFVDGNTHSLAVYLVDWDTNNMRNQKVEILDASHNVLDSRTVTGFTAGQYLVWNVRGYVKLRFTNIKTNAVVSGLFFGPAMTPPVLTGTASFAGTDAATKGSWKNVYGSEGYAIMGDAASYPTYVTVTTSGTNGWIWNAAPSDTRALQRANTGRVAACWYNSGSFSVSLNFADQTSRQVAIYMVDWDTTRRTQKIEILDANGNLLDTRTVTAFNGGQYLIWNMSGRVTIRLTNTNPAANAVLSGLFFR